MWAIFIRTFTILVVWAVSLLVLWVLIRGDKPVGLDFLDTRTYRYDSVSDIDRRIVEAWWIPDRLPLCATDIYLEFNVESKERLLAFDCTNTQAKNAFVEMMRQKDDEYIGVSWKEIVVEWVVSLDSF